MSGLEVRGVSVAYGGVRAVKGVDLDVGAQELVALVGANGAGKTSLLKALVGLVPAAGRVSWGGRNLAALPVHGRVAQGMALVPEGRGIFGRLTVDENLSLGAWLRLDATGVQRDRDRAFEFFPRLAERRHQKAGTLSGGEQQMLAIGRALMGRPKLLLLDEPSMGLAPMMVARIFEIIQRIAQEGMALLLVEQNARMALSISQRGYVMEGGQVVLAAPSAELLRDERVKAAYLGG